MRWFAKPCGVTPTKVRILHLPPCFGRFTGQARRDRLESGSRVTPWGSRPQPSAIVMKGYMSLFDVLGDPNKTPVISAAVELYAERLEEQNHRVKIFDTPKGLCMSCYMSHIYRSPKLEGGNWHITCTVPKGPSLIMPDDISYCNRFEKKGEQTLDDMKRVARLIEKEDGKRVGFTA